MRKQRQYGRGAPARYRLGPVAGLFLLAVLFIVSSRYGPMANAPEGIESVPLPETPASQEEGLRVYFLDVGQGDSQLIRIPGESGYFNVLIDTGEYAYADGLTEYLRGLGVEEIDALVCSHPHTDHMGCMARIVQRFKVGSLYMPLLPEGQTPTTRAYEALLDAAEDKGLTIIRLQEDALLESPPGAQFQVMSPRADADWEGANNYSAVIRLVYGETSFLFTGDAEEESEMVILEDGYSVGADVLKCGHHGSHSSTSQAFLDAVNPRYAVVSCGKDNSYGHPHREVLRQLGDLGVSVYRTDEDGTVLARSNGETVTFETGLPSVEEKTGGADRT